MNWIMRIADRIFYKRWVMRYMCGTGTPEDLCWRCTAVAEIDRTAQGWRFQFSAGNIARLTVGFDGSVVIVRSDESQVVVDKDGRVY